MCVCAGVRVCMISSGFLPVKACNVYMIDTAWNSVNHRRYQLAGKLIHSKKVWLMIICSIFSFNSDKSHNEIIEMKWTRQDTHFTDRTLSAVSVRYSCWTCTFVPSWFALSAYLLTLQVLSKTHTLWDNLKQRIKINPGLEASLRRPVYQMFLWMKQLGTRRRYIL